MTHDASRVRVDIGTGASTQRAPVELHDRSFRVLIIGDFSGGRDDGTPVQHRTIWRVDRDGVDAAMDGIAPELRLLTDPAAVPELITIRALDDFHPDHLLHRVPSLLRLRALRHEIAAQPLSDPPRDALPPGAESTTFALGHANLLDRMLDEAVPRHSPASTGDGAETADPLSELIRRAVRPHLVPEVPAKQRALLAGVDDVLGATLRVLLHHPEFSALEALWRGVEFFVRRSDVSERGQIELLDLGKTELATLIATAADGGAVGENLSSLHDRASADPRWSLVIAAWSLGPDDLSFIRGVMDLASTMNTPWLAAADPRLAGAMTFANGADVDDWGASPVPGWDALRGSPNARWLALALPRFLLRLPYGAQSDPIDMMSFEEIGEAASHESYLWGNPAFLCGLLAAEQHAADELPVTHGTIGGLPLHISRIDGVTGAMPCAEASMSQRALTHVLDRGLTPLVSERDGDAIRIPRLQSVALPPARLAIQAIGGR